MPLPKVAFGLILFCSLAFNALAQSTFYAASKSGLNMRQDHDGNSAVITKIPYGAKVTKAADASSHVVTTEGMSGEWQRILYEGRPGYVANVYLLPFSPPQGAAGDLKAYAAALSKQVGRSFKTTPMAEFSPTTERLLFENGFAFREFVGYEFHSQTLWIPDIDLQQGFVLARLLSPEPGLLSTSDVYPSKSSEGNSPSRHSVRLVKPYPGSDWVSSIHYEWCDGGCYNMDIRYEDGEVSITISNGV